MPKRIVIIGGVALGPKAACRCMRLDPEAQVTLVDENPLISYGGCGMPFYISGEINNIDDLRSTNYHVVRDAAFFARMKGFEVRTETRALAIDRKARTVTVRDLKSGAEEALPYDKLVIATGARPRIPPIEGHDLAGVHSVTKLEAAMAIRKSCEGGAISDAVIVGGGFIGLECAVALADMWGVKCSVVEMQGHILPEVLSPQMGLMAANDFARHDVNVYTEEKVLRLEGENGQVRRVVTDKRTIDAQLVIFAIGFAPNGQLARDAGLDVTGFGAIVVNEKMQSVSDPDIYAGGDCASIPNIITGKYGYLPLGSMANRQGRVIGTNLAGGNATFPGYVGTWACKLFDLSFCGTGMTLARARKEGFDAVGVAAEQLDRAHFYPEKAMMGMELVVERGTRRVLGAQGVSTLPDAVKARIDAIAGVLQFGGKPTLDDISNLEVAYAPPFAAAMDIVNVVANVADNVLAGRMLPVTGDHFIDLWSRREHNDVFFIDCRPAGGSKPVQEKYPEWHAIPLEEIAERVGEVPTDRPVALICNTGLRSYDAQLTLRRHGITNVVNSAGGMQSVLRMGLGPDVGKK